MGWKIFLYFQVFSRFFVPFLLVFIWFFVLFFIQFFGLLNLIVQGILCYCFYGTKVVKFLMRVYLSRYFKWVLFRLAVGGRVLCEKRNLHGNGFWEGKIGMMIWGGLYAFRGLGDCCCGEIFLIFFPWFSFGVPFRKFFVLENLWFICLVLRSKWTDLVRNFKGS